ncbi:MAG TPA: hypothetical protein VGI26_10130 [Solirubrobacteraceae bacterium]|jgi:hypothetical protein
MGMTYNLREREEQDAFCETLVRALPDDVIAVRQPRRAGRSMASLYLEGKGDLYHLVVDTLSAVPWELWCAVSTHQLDRHTAEAIEQRPLFRAIADDRYPHRPHHTQQGASVATSPGID